MYFSNKKKEKNTVLSKKLTALNENIIYLKNKVKLDRIHHKQKRLM